MSNLPITSLPIAISLDGSEYTDLVQGGTTKRATFALINSINPANLPVGGTIGQALVKVSSANYNAQWQALPGTGTIQNIATGTGLTGGPITTVGTISLAAISTGNVLANVSGISAAPLPNTPSAILDVITATRGNILYRGVAGWAGLAPGSAGQILTTGGAGADPAWSAVGSGTVQSVGLALPAIFTVSGSPVTTTGTLTGTLATQSANLVWSGPTTGAAAAPTFRALVGADLPNPSAATLGGIQSFAGSASQWIRSISTSGVPASSQPAFSDISGQATGAQLPNPSASTLGGVQSFAAQASKWINQISTSGVPTATQPAFSDISGGVTLAQLPAIGNNTVLGNISGGSATPAAISASQVLDTLSSTQGQILYRNASTWVPLSVGSAGQVLTTQGAAANPTWTTVTGTGTVTSISAGTGIDTGGSPITTVGTVSLAAIASQRILANVSGGSAVPIPNTMTSLLDIIGSTQGQVLYRGASNWTALPPGTSGQFLQTLGAGSTPQWAAAITSVATAGILTGGTITTTGTLNVNASIRPQGRLTLQSGVPVMTTTQSAKTTIYYTPYQGNLVPIYDGTNLVPTAVAEISVATTDTTKNPAAIGANKVNDWFIWNDSGTIRISHGPDWTNDTVRSAGTAIGMINGILLNSVSITNGPVSSRGTYVGTTRSNGSSQLDWIIGGSASGGTAGVLGVWNTYNRVNAAAVVTDTEAPYTYLGTTTRQASGSAGMQVSFVLGLQEDAVSASYAARSTTAVSASAAGGNGIGLDSTASYGFSSNLFMTATAFALQVGATNSGLWNVAIGRHFVAALENSDGSNSNTFNTASNNTLSVGVRM